MVSVPSSRLGANYYNNTSESTSSVTTTGTGVQVTNSNIGSNSISASPDTSEYSPTPPATDADTGKPNADPSNAPNTSNSSLGSLVQNLRSNLGLLSDTTLIIDLKPITPKDSILYEIRNIKLADGITLKDGHEVKIALESYKNLVVSFNPSKSNFFNVKLNF